MGRPKNGTNQQRTCEEKANLIEEYYNSGTGYRAFAQSYGISPSLFYSWVQKYEENGIDGLRYKTKRTPKANAVDQEIMRLKLVIAEQQIELQGLRKEAQKKGVMDTEEDAEEAEEE